MLNIDQQKALNAIVSWSHSNEKYFILDGAGGTGKTFLTKEIIKRFSKDSSIILAPTHEALSQLREKINGDYLFKTLASSLGITPTTTSESLKFEHKAFPTFWKDISFCILDEISQVSEWQWELLKQLDTKILLIGHESQLPPIDSTKYRSYNDLCLSPLFSKGLPKATLKIPMRNTGELWEFTKKMEERIYTKEKSFPRTFDSHVKDIREFCYSDEGKEAFLSGDLKIIVYHNSEVELRNSRVRKNLFGEKAEKEKYIPGDVILLTSPVNIIENLELYDEGLLRKRVLDKEVNSLFNNTKGIVKNVTIVSIKLNRKLEIPCYKIQFKTQEGLFFLYEPKEKRDMERIDDYYKHLAWSKSSTSEKNRAFSEKHFIRHCFANILHSYAMTSYRVQGMSIENVIVICRDLERVKNPVEQAKHFYVGVSRASKNLMLYWG